MKGIRIDPRDRTVTEIVSPPGFRSIQKAVDDGEGNCTFCLAGQYKGDTVYVNDEGLYLFDTFFELPGCGQGLFAGPAFIVGKEIGETENTRDPKSTVREVTSKIRWHDRLSALKRSKELGI